MQRKLVSVLLGAALLGTMFTGCGQQADAGQAESKTESSEGTSGSTEEESKDACGMHYPDRILLFMNDLTLIFRRQGMKYRWSGRAGTSHP